MKKRYFVIGAVGLVAAAVAAAGIWTFPLWHTAYLLYHLFQAESLDCRIEVSLQKEGLPEHAGKFLQAVSWALGMEGSDILEWQASGRISEGKGYLQIYCDAAKEPVTEVYFEKDDALVNVEMLYGMIQEHFQKEHPLMGTMVPDWKYGTYLSLEQIQEIFQIDLKKMFQEGSSGEMPDFSYWEIFLMLQGMDRKKTGHGGWQFETAYRDWHIAFETGREGRAPYLHVSGAGQKGQALKDASAVLSPGRQEEIHIPDSLMKQEEAAQFQKIWAAVSYLIEGGN